MREAPPLVAAMRPLLVRSDICALSSAYTGVNCLGTLRAVSRTHWMADALPRETRTAG